LHIGSLSIGDTQSNAIDALQRSATWLQTSFSKALPLLLNYHDLTLIHRIANNQKNEANRPDQHQILETPFAVFDPAVNESNEVTDGTAKKEHDAGDCHSGRAPLEHIDQKQDEADKTTESTDAGEDHSDKVHDMPLGLCPPKRKLEMFFAPR
jgi:hypothetical protein